MSILKPIDFLGSNKVYTAPPSAPDVQDLHVYQDENQTVSCWVCDSMAARRKFMETGEIYLSVMGRQQPPVFLSIDRPFTPSIEN